MADRFYTTPVGTLPSVTTILAATESDAAKRRLQNWQDGNKGAREIAANRGNRVHEIAARYLRERQESFHDPQNYILEAEELAPYFLNLVPTLQRFGKLYWIEGLFQSSSKPYVWSSHGYAGTPDWIVEVSSEVTLYDLKTSDFIYYRHYPNKEDPESHIKAKGYVKFRRVRLQLVAYAIAVEECLNLKLDRLAALVTTPTQCQEFSLTPKDREEGEKEWFRRLKEYKNQT